MGTKPNYSAIQEAFESAQKAKLIREKRYYNYLKDVIADKSALRLNAFAIKHKCNPLTRDEYKKLGLLYLNSINREQSDAIYYWKYIQDSQFGEEKKRIAKARLESVFGCLL